MELGLRSISLISLRLCSLPIRIGHTTPGKTTRFLVARIGNSPVLQERFYAKAYLKYFYNSYLYIGENMNMCHSLYRVGVEDIVLQKGDSIYFNPTYPHGKSANVYFITTDYAMPYAKLKYM